jgi:hypothetical protein
MKFLIFDLRFLIGERWLAVTDGADFTDLESEFLATDKHR